MASGDIGIDYSAGIVAGDDDFGGVIEYGMKTVLPLLQMFFGFLKSAVTSEKCKYEVKYTITAVVGNFVFKPFDVDYQHYRQDHYRA